MELDADGGDEGDKDDGDDGEQSDDVDDCSPSSWQLLATGCNWMRASRRHKSYSWRHRLTQGGTSCDKKNNVSPKQGWFSAISTTSRVFQHDKK